jgi:glycosyltransferase involved in cell wall biosynthesis
VDEAFFTPGKRRSAGTEGLTLLFCGRLNGPHQQKGVDILLRAMQLILKQHRVTLEIVGTGPRERQYKKMTGQLGIENHVKFLGFIPGDGLPRIYANADLFVLPTRRESFGLTLAEAMAAGLPVVSTSITAVPEVVSDGETGLLVPPNNPEKLAAAVNLLLGQPEKMRVMGQKGRVRAKELFTWEKVAGIVSGYYQAVLGK